jgi:hypothetical protein
MLFFRRRGRGIKLNPIVTADAASAVCGEDRFPPHFIIITIRRRVGRVRLVKIYSECTLSGPDARYGR